MKPASRARRRRSAAGSAAPASRRRAKVFWSGRSQAVRLPKEFRLDTREVWIHREGERIVLEPPHVPMDAHGWPVDFWEVFGQLPDRFDLGDRDRDPERGPWTAYRG